MQMPSQHQVVHYRRISKKLYVLEGSGNPFAGYVIRGKPDQIFSIADYTAVIEMADVPKWLAAKAFVIRGIAKKDISQLEGAISDWIKVIQMTIAPLVNRSAAAILAMSSQRVCRRASWIDPITRSAKSSGAATFARSLFQES